LIGYDISFNKKFTFTILLGRCRERGADPAAQFGRNRSIGDRVGSEWKHPNG